MKGFKKSILLVLISAVFVSVVFPGCSSRNSDSTSSAQEICLTESGVNDENGNIYTLLKSGSSFEKPNEYTIQDAYCEILTLNSINNGHAYYYSEETDNGESNVILSMQDGYTQALVSIKVKNIDTANPAGRNFYNDFSTKTIFGQSTVLSSTKWQSKPGNDALNDTGVELLPGEEATLSAIINVPLEISDIISERRALIADGSAEALKKLEDEKYQRNLITFINIGDDKYAVNLRDDMIYIER